MLREITDAGLALTATEEQFLLSACELNDQLAVLKSAMADQPLMVKGSMGQPIPNGLFS